MYFTLLKREIAPEQKIKKRYPLRGQPLVDPLNLVGVTSYFVVRASH